MKKKCLLAFLLAVLAGQFTLAQLTFSGKVIDEDGRPIPGAHVRLEETTLGTATDKDGAFLIRHVPEGRYILRASCLDYETAAQPVDGSRQNMVFRLKNAYINLNQVVVTGTGTHHRLKDSPVPIEVLSAADIKKAGTPTFEDALTRLNPSLSFATNGGGTSLNMNGLESKYVLILVNGKRLAGDVSGSIDFGRIDMSRVKRIEVLKGAASALYGSDAIAGVINVITDEPKNKLNVVSNTRYGRNNRFIQSVNADVNTGKFASSTSYQRQQADGWQLNPMVEDKKGNLVPTDKEASTGFHSNSITQLFTYTPGKRLSLYARGAFFNNRTLRPLTEYDYDMAHETYTYGAGGKYLLGNASYIEADFYADNFTSNYEYINDTKKFKTGDTDLRKRQRYYNANVKGVFRAGKYHKITVGAEFVNDYLKNLNDMVGGDHRMYTASLYAQDEIRLWKKLQIIAGLRYSYHETFKSNVSPKLSMMYPVGPINLRASYAGGFRTPTLQQLYAYSESRSGKLSLGNPELDPEKSHFVSGNVEYVHNRFTVSFSAYLNQVNDMINYAEREPIDGREVQQQVNIDKARIKGFDISFNSYLGAGFSLGAGYNYADGKDERTKERLNKSIQHTASVNGNWSHQWDWYRLNVNVNGRIQGRRYSQTYGYAPKFQLWNLNTTHVFSPKGDFTLEPGVGVENIFNYRDDRPWNSNYATLTPGRTFYVSLLVRFKQ